MKKTISLLLAMVMLSLSMPVMAAKEDASKMQEVLLLVKEKISIPEELTEFSGNISEYAGKISYYFDWTSTDYEKSISVSCDDAGRIISYYDSSLKVSDKKISAISKAEIIAFAEEFLRKTAPEAFLSEDDRLFYDEDAYVASGNMRYNLTFIRKKGGVPVNNSNASVTVGIWEDEMYVRSMNISFDYDTAFAQSTAELENYQERYKELFPMEPVYQDEYKPLAEGNEPKNVPRLIYRIKNNDIGYMDIATGERMVESAEDDYYRKEVYASDSANMESAGGGGSSLTLQELGEIEKVEGLLGQEEIIARVKKLPYINFTDDLELRGSSLYKNDIGKYYYRINYYSNKENTYKSFNVNADAQTGEIISLTNNPGGYNDEVSLTDAEKAAAEEKIDEFLSLVAKDKLLETKEEDAEDYRSTISRHFVRMVNGVKYVDNGISISFDGKNNIVQSYSANFTEGEFANPAEAIGEAAAYAKILEDYEISPIYIKNGGEYKKAATLSCRSVQIDAISGEVISPTKNSQYGYSDISGHWAEEAATKLAEIQIGIDSERLEPDRKMTQEEFLRLAAAGIIGQYYSPDDSEEFYQSLIRDKFVLEEEKAPTAEITREDAFVFVIRMAGLERVARLSDIYKVSYKDQDLLSDGRIGYAAILSGLGVICGDGGNLRPKDAITRAEAIVVVYKYLLTL